MNKVVALFAACLLSLAPISSHAKAKLVAELKLETQRLSDGRITVSGKTNLPDGTKLMISAISNVDDAYYSDSVDVKNGSFKTEPFGPKAGLPIGDYTIEAIMPIPSVQPASVRAVIGDAGEALTGPLSKQAFDERNVESTTTHIVGSKAEITAAKASRKKLVQQLTNDANSLIAAGRGMTSLRRSESLEAARQCGINMRELQPKAKALRDKVDVLSGNLQYISAAASSAIFCVSCLEGTAEEACDRAAEYMRRKEL